MLMEIRQREIAETIAREGKITIADITHTYGISDESARRDLRMLEQQRLCKRTHGGAIRLAPIGQYPPVDRDFEKMPVWDNYKAIAEKAASLIRENDMLYLTGGSFGYIMTMLLPRHFRYAVVVNSVDVAKALRGFDNIDVYLAGGKMRQSGSLVDALATQFVSQLHFDLCFITGAGLTASFGLSNVTAETAAFQRAVIQNSRRRVLLLPSAKIGADSFMKVCDANAFDTLITDWDCTPDQLSALEETGMQVIALAEPEHHEP